LGLRPWWTISHQQFIILTAGLYFRKNAVVGPHIGVSLFIRPTRPFLKMKREDWKDFG
jgi:hypothetical protein